jgi:putative addiction module CopG family antidote
MQLITAKVETGRYRSASEVVRAALRLFEQQDRSDTTRHDTTVQVESRRDAR